MRQIFWGYIFIFFDLKIGSFNLLANFVGYILICRGLRLLAEDSAEFERASPWALGLLLVEIGRIFLRNGLRFSILLFVFNCGTLAASLYLRYRIICGIGELERKYMKDLGAEHMRFLWRVQAVLEGGSMFLPYIPYAAIFVVIFAVASVILNIFFLLFLNRARKAPETNRPSSL